MNQSEENGKIIINNTCPYHQLTRNQFSYISGPLQSHLNINIKFISEIDNELIVCFWHENEYNEIAKMVAVFLTAKQHWLPT